MLRRQPLDTNNPRCFRHNLDIVAVFLVAALAHSLNLNERNEGQKLGRSCKRERIVSDYAFFKFLLGWGRYALFAFFSLFVCLPTPFDLRTFPDPKFKRVFYVFRCVLPQSWCCFAGRYLHQLGPTSFEGLNLNGSTWPGMPNACTLEGKQVCLYPLLWEFSTLACRNPVLLAY